MCYGDTFKIVHNCSQTSIFILFEVINIPFVKLCIVFLQNQIPSLIFFSGTILEFIPLFCT